jgi:RHS repeat-associated protein
MQRGGQDYFYHGNMAVTDSNGLTVERYRYSDYGQPSFFDGSGSQLDESAISNPCLFGLRHDPETGLYYSGSRYLDPITGRFTTRDPSNALWDLDFQQQTQREMMKLIMISNIMKMGYHTSTTIIRNIK